MGKKNAAPPNWPMLSAPTPNTVRIAASGRAIACAGSERLAPTIAGLCWSDTLLLACEVNLEKLPPAPADRQPLELPAEVDGGDLFALVPQLPRDGQPGLVIECPLGVGQLA